MKGQVNQTQARWSWEKNMGSESEEACQKTPSFYKAHLNQLHVKMGLCSMKTYIFISIFHSVLNGRKCGIFDKIIQNYS